MRVTVNGLNFLQVSNSVNGQTRYVIHYLNLLTPYEKNKIDFYSGDNGYQTALNKAKQLGGKKYHNRSYGGGIVFTTSKDNLGRLATKINNLADCPKIPLTV